MIEKDKILNIDNILQYKIRSITDYDDYDYSKLFNRMTICEEIIYTLYALDYINTTEKKILYDRIKQHKEFVESIMESDDN